MKQCMAYRVSQVHPNAWVRCLHRPARGLRFCRAHANGLRGAVLGLIVHKFSDRANRPATAGQRVN